MITSLLGEEAEVSFELHYHVLERWRVQSRAMAPSSHLLVQYDRLWETFPSAYSHRPVSSHPVHSTTFRPARKWRHVLFDLLTSFSWSILKVNQRSGRRLIDLQSCENAMHPDGFTACEWFGSDFFSGTLYFYGLKMKVQETFWYVYHLHDSSYKPGLGHL